MNKYSEQIVVSFTEEEVEAIINALKFVAMHTKFASQVYVEDRVKRRLIEAKQIFREEIKWDFPVPNSSDL